MLAPTMVTGTCAGVQVLLGALRALLQLRVQRGDADGVLQLLHHLEALKPGEAPPSPSSCSARIQCGAAVPAASPAAGCPSQSSEDLMPSLRP